MIVVIIQTYLFACLRLFLQVIEGNVLRIREICLRDLCSPLSNQVSVEENQEVCEIMKTHR
jgi:uncharacterized protein YpbB